MSQELSTENEPRKRVLLLAHTFDAGLSMESRLSWFRAVQAAEKYDVTVISSAGPENSVSTLSLDQQRNLNVVVLPHGRIESVLKKFPVFFYLAYRLWQRRVLKLAKQLHEKNSFDLVHQVSYCGYREPGECWRLEAPFIWGPIGGTQNTPWRFLPGLNFVGMLQEMLRSFVNLLQLKFSSRVRKALSASTCVISANREVQQALQNYCNCDSYLQLETGLTDIAAADVRCRNEGEPLRILWAGRLESWKALPLLLKSLAKFPAKIPYKLRVVGGGSCELRWKKLASDLGIDSNIEWAGWPIYEQRDEHYRWADVFIFTSLRDTSGTGLLEALAAGVPIIGLDHQGARDIMTESCAIKIAVDSPSSVSNAIRDAITRLAQDTKQLQQLSSGALQRASDYHWDCLADEMMHYYDIAMAQCASTSQAVTKDEPLSYENSLTSDSAADSALATTISGAN